MEMKTSHKTPIRRLALASAVALGLAGANAIAAEGPNPTKEGYVLSSSGAVVQTAFGECVHTTSWKPSMAIPGCDGYVEKAEPAAAGPEPEPIQVAAVTPPKQPTLESVTLNVETLFAFDESTLRPEAREKLDQIANRLGNYPVVTDVQVVGYADRIGTDQYNKDLSQRRAQAVAEYLNQRARDGGAQSSMQVEGRGEANPVVTCENTGSRDKLIECLQPNRRVEVNISAREYTNQ